MPTRLGHQRPRGLGHPHPRAGRGVRPRLLPAGVRGLRPPPDARLHGLLGHAVALPALVVRQVVREAEDALRSRRLRPAVRDGDQFQPGARLPHARQLAAAADPHHRARLRAQRLLQEQLHLPLDPRRVHDRHLQIARAARAQPTRRIPASASSGSRRSSMPPMRCRSSAAATSPSASCSDDDARQAAIDASRPQLDPFHRIHAPQEHARTGPAPHAAWCRTRTCCSSSATTTAI